MSPSATNSNTIRAFIAIELPLELRRALAEIERQIQTRTGGPGTHRTVRWTPVENIHLTLKFLGEISTSSVQALAQRLSAAASQHPVFTFQVMNLGAFPNLRHPRVIWVGIEAPSQLTNLQKAIEVETLQLGYPAEDRPFSPHLTLGRINQNARPEEVSQLSRTLESMSVGIIGQVQADVLHLYRSDLQPGGAVYKKLSSFRLKEETA